MTGRESAYVNGVQLNAEKIKSLYPGWVMRVYTLMGTSYDKSLCSVLCENGHVDICDVRFIPNYGDISKYSGVHWRFLPLDDPLVDIFMSRDLDSVVTSRETSAVAQWLERNETFHAMRDHQKHNNIILAGMWGAKVNKMPAKQGRRMLSVFFNKTNPATKFKSYYGVDQQLLATIYKKEIEPSFIAHDSYFCKRFKHSIPFPTKRENKQDFVGNYVAPKRSNVRRECPVECRPQNGRDWKFC